MEPRWDNLRHAYGPGSDIPGLLVLAETDLRRGHEPGSTWFKLWSAFCHQGDAYSASYAAVPRLVRLAEKPEYRALYDPLLLAASIEVSRLTGAGPELQAELAQHYRAAVERGRELAADALKNQALDADSTAVYRGCVAAFCGQPIAAQNHFGEGMSVCRLTSRWSARVRDRRRKRCREPIAELNAAY